MKKTFLCLLALVMSSQVIVAQKSIGDCSSEEHCDSLRERRTLRYRRLYEDGWSA